MKMNAKSWAQLCYLNVIQIACYEVGGGREFNFCKEACKKMIILMKCLLIALVWFGIK